MPPIANQIKNATNIHEPPTSYSAMYLEKQGIQKNSRGALLSRHLKSGKGMEASTKMKRKWSRR